MQKNGWLSIGCVWVLSVQMAQAAITLDRTSAIYDDSARSISLNITNENKQQPYLAQAWLEGTTNKKTHVLMVVPPVQRLEAGG